MSTSRYPGLDHPTSSLRGPPSPSPPPPDESDSISTRLSQQAMERTNARSPSAKRPVGSASGPSVSHSPSAEDGSKRRRLASGGTSAAKEAADGVDYDKPPISPVVLGFNLANTDPGMKDTVRSALLMKEEQQRLIQQRRGTTATTSSATSTPPQPQPGRTTAETAPGSTPSVPSQGETMDVDGQGSSVKAANKAGGPPSVEVQGASPALGTGGFASGGLATRSHDEGRQKAGGLSILTPANTDNGGAKPTASPRGGLSPQPHGNRTPVSGLYPAPQRSASSSSQPGSGPSSARPSSFPAPPPHTAGRPAMSAHNGGSNNGTSAHNQLGSPAGPYGGPSSAPGPGYGPSSSSARGPGPSPFAGQQQRPPSPNNTSHQALGDMQRSTFMAPFERFYDALVDSRTLQLTLDSIHGRSNEAHRRVEEELRRFNHMHTQAANLLNTLQASSTSLQDMVRREVAVVREETRQEVESVWKRIRQLEQGFTDRGLAIPPQPPAPRRSPVPAVRPTDDNDDPDNDDDEGTDQLAGDGPEDGSAKGAKRPVRGGGRTTGGGRGAARPPKGVQGGKASGA